MADTSKTPLGLIAGGGALPAHLIQTCKEQNRPYVTVALLGEADRLPEEPTLWIRIGEAAKAFEAFHAHGVVEVVMAGKVHRPGLSDLRPDWRTLKFLARAGTTAFTNKDSVGDDRLLRAVIAELEREGFVVVGVEDVLADLHVSPGALGQMAPTKSDQADISLGLGEARALGAADIGQSVVVLDGVVIGREGPEGTDALIRSARHASGQRPILVKTSKPSQDRRADLPVIGPETVQRCVACGYRGLVIEAGGTLVLDRQAVVRIADEAGVFVYASDMKKDLPSALAVDHE